MDRPTLDNWMRPPHPFWSFRHVRELIPTARIRHGHHPRALPFEPAGNLLDLRFESKAGERVVGEYLANTQTDALVAIKDGKVVLEWMAPGIRDDEPHLMFSVTKSITALLCGALVGAGKIDPDAPVVQYVPVAPAPVYVAAPAPVYYAPPVVYAPPPVVYAPPIVSFGFGFGRPYYGGHYHHHHHGFRRR
jgi:CubicO group peptidase (beta-lactamase class C family)